MLRPNNNIISSTAGMQSMNEDRPPGGEPDVSPTFAQLGLAQLAETHSRLEHSYNVNPPSVL